MIIPEVPVTPRDDTPVSPGPVPAAGAKPQGPHRWSVFRTGGFDQVGIATAEDLRHLHELDQKLWAVLAMPTSGVEFDERTMALLDTDSDGRLRAPEVLAAVSWLCRVLRAPEVVFEPGDALPLDALAADDTEAAQLLATARQVLVHLGRDGADTVALGDLADSTRLFAADKVNGDGVVPAALAEAEGDAAAAQAIALIAATLGPVPDRSGAEGVDRARVEAFFEAAQAVSDWRARAEGADAAAQALAPLGEHTGAAVAALDAMAAKVEDYFTRCRLAAYDHRAVQALNASEPALAALAPASLSADDAAIAALPLALVTAQARLPLADGVNPAWTAALATLRDAAVRPLLGERDALTLEDWSALAARLQPWRDWQASRPATPVADVDVTTLRALRDQGVASRLHALIDADLAAATATAQIDALERLLRLRRDLATLLRNFVNLADFYDGAPPRTSKAIFQAGTLYLDQRSFDLCLRVHDMGRHAALAPLAGTFLVYCQCVRDGQPPMTIVAAVTDGDVDDMMVPGRNGLFYDRQGRDWHASVQKIVTHPISVRQAFWSPYQRLARMTAEQIQKFAAAQDKALDGKAGASLAQVAAKAAAAPVPAPAVAAKPAAAPFDIARFAGIFAAIGLALGAVGTALTALVGGLVSMPLWKLPLVVAGVLLFISGPSMLLAWFKLRRRNLGPLLDANGWAINIRARVNIPFGTSLTAVARRPEGARGALPDPFADKPVAWSRWILAGVVLLVLMLLSWRGSLTG